ncbi:MAG: methylmalonyl-CoA mutase family protein [Acidimicrobiales bacterium]
MTSTPDLALAADFPAADHEQWRALVDKVLKGASFERRLVSNTYDGIAIQPLYTAADSPAHASEQHPGQPGYTRGATAAGPAHGAWEIRQTQQHPEPVEANRRILEDLGGGVNSLALRLDIAGAGDVDGVVIGGSSDVATLLDGVYLDLVSVTLEAGPSFAAAARLLIEAWETAGVSIDQRRGSLGADPLGALAATGRLAQGLDAALGATVELATETAAWPHVRAIDIDTAPYVDAGASEAQELAAMVATGVAYLRALTDGGLTADAAAAQIGFTVSADADVFATIAKLRAARRVWSHALAAAGVSETSAPFAARTATRMMSRRDPWVNMLRTTAACFAAGAAGAPTVTVQPFDAALGLPDGLARRIARNTQLVLQEESHVGIVADPAGGSYYVESLTDQLAERAWERFVEIEAAGGMAAVLLDGSEAKVLGAIRGARAANIATRRDALTGVSEFPNLAEEPLTRPAPDVEALRADARARWGAAADTSGPATVIEPLGASRLAAGFEALRDASDAHLSATGSRPRVFLANLGPIATHTARASYAKNFLEAGGVETLGTTGEDDAAVTAAFAASGCSAAVICSSDAVYADRAADVASALRAAGARRVLLAGNPGEQRGAYEAAGVDEFIHVGVDVLVSLRGILEAEGVSL